MDDDFPYFLDPKKETVVDFPNDIGKNYILSEIKKEIGSLKDSAHPWKTFPIGVIPMASKNKRGLFIKFVKDGLKKQRHNNDIHNFTKKQLFVCILYVLDKKYNITDLDNLTKNLLDALKGIAFEDDSKIVKLSITKIRLQKGLSKRWRDLLECAYVGVAAY